MIRSGQHYAISKGINYSIFNTSLTTRVHWSITAYNITNNILTFLNIAYVMRIMCEWLWPHVHLIV